MRISLAWWNTSLSTSGKPRATEQEKAFAVQVVRFLTEALGVDCLALGEVTAADLGGLLLGSGLRDYAFHDGTLRFGRLQFDTGLIYRRTKLRVLHSLSIVTKRGNHSLKVANRVDLLAPDSRSPLHLFVSHWPSRLWCEENGADRHLLGVRLRDAVEEVSGLYERQPSTILMGDYNDEPFDSSLSGQLLAARDRKLVRKNPQLLYNPFWRHLGERDPHIPGEPEKSACGTYYYRSGLTTRWHTFDQIMFSSAFLGSSEWELDERGTQIVRIPFPNGGVSSSRNIFDHYPVASVIYRETQHGKLC